MPDRVLNGVTCTGAGDCWAVGFSAYSTAAKQPLFEHYTGSSWTIVSTPNRGAGNLNGVTCVSAGDCWAVGFFGISDGVYPLIEHYAGSNWAIVTTLNPKPGLIPSSGVLNGVTCVSAGDCWAVGFSGISGNASQLIEHYTGSVWTIASTLNPGSHPQPSSGQLNGVICASAGDCWAVGIFGFAGKSAIEHYMGSGWAISTPDPSTGDLAGVTCASAADCWAVGRVLSTLQADQPLIEHYTASGWAISTANSNPALIPSPSQLNGVTCVSTRDCWAVGFSGIFDVQPLIEHYAGSSWAIISPNPNRGT